MGIVIKGNRMVIFALKRVVIKAKMMIIVILNIIRNDKYNEIDNKDISITVKSALIMTIYIFSTESISNDYSNKSRITEKSNIEKSITHPNTYTVILITNMSCLSTRVTLIIIYITLTICPY